MRKFAVLAAGAALAFGAAPASADVVCEWMDFAQLITAASQPPADAPRTGEHDRAQTQAAIAMFEALNAIDRRYESYLGMAAGDPTASQEAAAATAAYQVLLSHFPGQKTALEDSYNVTMMGISNVAARDKGKAIGEAAAKLALASGGFVPDMAQTPYRPRTAPGVWTATQLPVFQPYSFTFKPWILKNWEEVRPGPPPALDSERWAKDFEEIKQIGAKSSKTRTPQQSLMARYRITPNMTPSLRLIADAKGRRVVDNARMFAMFNMVSDDANVATGAAKLHYNFWRPITAIRNAEDDGNPATTADPAWEPLIGTPNHPEYPCAHCSGTAAIAEVMKAEVGASPPGGVRVASRSIPNSIVQVVPNWDGWVKEVSASRTYGGVHYRFSNEAGEELGRKVGQLALQRVMRPLPQPKKKGR
ncbi:MAG TPA: vanadium-dependent haloperoxidase [Allosphingosinicella sp.]|uniref:vanadium-dependent haloperoxidase n=1 Tax=Allosphingosinicella sp. TaxID=2823234 RepID=UPI002ED98A18